MKKVYLAALVSGLFSIHNAWAVQVDGINVNGLQRVERETVLSYVNITPHSNVSDDELNESFKKLYETGLFSDVKFDMKGNTLNINVSEF